MIKAFLLDVQKTEDDRIQGNVHDLCLDEKCSFVGMDKAVLLMDQAMDQKDSSTNPDTWQNAPVPARGAARFHIRVLFREQNTWQGEVTRIKTGEKRYFRSVLELLRVVSGTI